jgi:hypothetical protein
MTRYIQMLRKPSCGVLEYSRCYKSNKVQRNVKESGVSSEIIEGEIREPKIKDAENR